MVLDRSLRVGVLTMLAGAAIAWPATTVAAITGSNGAAIPPRDCTTPAVPVIQVGPGYYTPQVQKGLVPFTTQSWSFYYPSDESVTSFPITLFTSGLSPHSFSFTFFGAGTYTYHSTGSPVPTGTVEVKICQLPATARLGASVSGQMAADYHAGWVEDVEFHRPGASMWQWLAYGSKLDWFTFTAARTGTYYVRTRLRQTSTNKTSGFSPTSAVKVS